MRLVQIYIPKEEKEKVQDLLDDDLIIGSWSSEQDNDFLRFDLLVAKKNSGETLDRLEKRFAHMDNFRIVVLPVEATVPRTNEAEEKEKQAKEQKRQPQVARVELHADITEQSRLTSVYLAMVALSAIVAGVGIIRDYTAAIVGAMVIAPLLGPNVGLSLATTLADWKLARNAAKALLSGIVLVMVISVLWGLLVNVEPDMPGIAPRTQVGLGDITLALASGAAGVLAFTTGASATLVGVMVAVSLLPPLVTSGLLLGSGHPCEACGAAMVFLTNIICINLSGVVTFLIQGMRPLTWWESKKARRYTIIAIVTWIFLLGLLVGVLLLTEGWRT